MGNGPSVPSEEERLRLIASVDDQCAKAAECICAADALVLFTGAGFSADSGLAVYADVASVPEYFRRGLTYPDLCQPCHLENDPALFWGFWGGCFNDYRRTAPHVGYAIIRKWRDRLFGDTTSLSVTLKAAQEEANLAILARLGLPCRATSEPYPVEGCSGAFHVFTSNVDAHSFDYFEPEEVRECHGNTELYQCAKQCTNRVWRAPPKMAFNVNLETMLAEPGCLPLFDITVPANDLVANATVGATKGRQRQAVLSKLPTQEGDVSLELFPEDEFPQCGGCGGAARPAILMFGDDGWTENDEQERRYNMWCSALLDAAGKKKPRCPECSKVSDPTGPNTQQSSPQFPEAESEQQSSQQMFFLNPLNVVDTAEEGAIATELLDEGIPSAAEKDMLQRIHTADDAARPMRVVLLEIGAGGTITTVRGECESLSGKLVNHGAECTVIRINPDLPLPDIGYEGVNFVSIMSRGLDALHKIDAKMNCTEC